MPPPPPPPPAEEWYQAATPPSTTAQTATAVAAEATARDVAIAAEATARNVAIAASAATDAGLLAAEQLLDVKKTAKLQIACVVGAEAAVAADAIEIACTIKDSAPSPAAVAAVRQVLVRTFAVTDNKGDIAAAGTPVGTLKKVINPATGSNEAWFETTSGGLFSFRVTNDVAEETVVQIVAEGCDPETIKLTFA